VKSALLTVATKKCCPVVVLGCAAVFDGLSTEEEIWSVSGLSYHQPWVGMVVGCIFLNVDGSMIVSVHLGAK
jgi:hypothetical protein